MVDIQTRFTRNVIRRDISRSGLMSRMNRTLKAAGLGDALSGKTASRQKTRAVLDTALESDEAKQLGLNKEQLLRRIEREEKNTLKQENTRKLSAADQLNRVRRREEFLRNRTSFIRKPPDSIGALRASRTKVADKQMADAKKTNAPASQRSGGVTGLPVIGSARIPGSSLEGAIERRGPVTDAAARLSISSLSDKTTAPVTESNTVSAQEFADLKDKEQKIEDAPL